MEENKEPEAQAPSASEASPPTAADRESATPPAAEEKKVEAMVELNPANAAREAIYNIVKDREMTIDEQVSAIAPLIKTINTHRIVTDPKVDDPEVSSSPRADVRWSMLEDKDSPGYTATNVLPQSPNNVLATT